jgi:hypothetical protein
MHTTPAITPTTPRLNMPHCNPPNPLNSSKYRPPETSEKMIQPTCIAGIEVITSKS